MAEDTPPEEKKVETPAVETPAAPAEAPATPAVKPTEEQLSGAEKGARLDFIASLADANGVQDPEVEDIKTAVDKVKKARKPNEAAPATPPETPAAPATPTTEAPATPAVTPPEAPAAETPATPAAEVNEEESTFFANNKNKVPDFKTNDEINAYIKDHYAVEIKGPEDYKTLFNSVDKWRTDAQAQSKTSRDHEDLLAAFTELPPALSDAFQVWASAGDWEASLQDFTGRVDYSKDFASHDKNDMLKAYFPDEVRDINAKADEEMDDEQKKTQLDTFYKSAGKLYANDKQTFDVRRAKAITDQEDKQRAFKESALTSVSQLKTEYPDFNDSDIQSVRDHLVNGSVYNLLFERDGTYKKDAAIRAALLMFGQKEIDSSRRKAAADATSQANLDLVTRGGDKPTNRGGQQLQPDTTRANEILKKVAAMVDTSPYSHKGD